MMLATTAPRPFDAAPDLLQDAAAIDDFMGQGMVRFERLAETFGLGDDPEGARLLGAALQAYYRRDLPMAVGSLKSFAANESRMAVLGRVFEVLYKVVTRNAGPSALEWVNFAVEVYLAHPQVAEAQRLALEFFTYNALWNHALTVYAQLPAEAFEPWYHHIMHQRALSVGFQPRWRFSFVLLTWNRADLLDRCLTEIRAKAGSDDYQIIVGVNASSDHTARVLERQGIDEIHWNTRNDSIDYYRTVFAAAQGATVIEIDDNVVELPENFDLILERHLKTFPEFGYIGFQPTRLDQASGARALMEGGLASAYRRCERDGLVVDAGPVWGCCAAIAKRDWLEIGGFYGVRMSKRIGEEPQLIRKLRMRGRDGALIRGHVLLKAY